MTNGVLTRGVRLFAPLRGGTLGSRRPLGEVDVDGAGGATGQLAVCCFCFLSGPGRRYDLGSASRRWWVVDQTGLHGRTKPNETERPVKRKGSAKAKTKPVHEQERADATGRMLRRSE